MGFKSRGFVFADDNPAFTSEDLNEARKAVKGGRIYEVVVSAAQGVCVRMAISKIETVPKRNGPQGLEITGGSRVSDWRFEGVVSELDPKLHGHKVRGYAVCGYNLGNEKDIVDLYIQIDK